MNTLCRMGYPGIRRVSFTRAICAILMLTAGASASAGDQTVRLDKKEATVAVSIGGKEFATFHFGKDLPKPFFSPVRAPDGAIITRGLENPVDHPHHKGIWLSIDEVNEVKFWAEKGKIENVSVDILVPDADPAKMRVVNHWLGVDGKPLLTETTVISISANRMIGYDVHLKAGDEQVTFADTKEGLFGIRLADTLREKEGGKVVNSNGLLTTKECWGKEAGWVDYYGPVEGKTYGVAIFDHPLNFRPSRYHVRDYGLFTISPFGIKSYSNGKQPADEIILLPGKSFRLRYGLYVHTGDTDEGKVPDVYLDYLKNS